MIGVVIVTHGRLAHEFRAALEHVVGPQEQIETISIGPDDDLDVPDFLNEPLTLSGLVLSVSPPVVSGPPRALASLLPVVPTTLREFYRDEAVGAFLRVYQGAGRPPEPVTLGLRIVDSHGATVQEKSETLASERFAGTRTADYQFEVPVSNLVPGAHLLTVQATAGQRVFRRDVRFVVKR